MEYAKRDWTSKGLIIQCSPNGSVIATANRHPFAQGEGEANAHLIASAPDLYEALKGLLWITDVVEPSQKLGEYRTIARQALSKAEVK